MVVIASNAIATLDMLKVLPCTDAMNADRRL